jgi:hypothetical protein
MSEENNDVPEEKGENNGFVDQLGRGLGGIFKFLIRLTFTLVLAVALGAGIFYGIQSGLPAIEQKYVQPVRDNSAAIAALETQATDTAATYEEQIDELQDRLDTLELQSDSEKETIAALEIQVATLVPLLEEQAALAEQVALLDAQINDLDSALSGAQTENQATLDSLDESIAILQVENAYSAEEIYLELQFVKAMALVTRAQLYIAQENLGLAATDVVLAQEILADLATLDAFADVNLTPVLTRLALAIEGLPDTPDQAAADLDTAWELLAAGISVPPVPAVDEAAAEE